MKAVGRVMTFLLLCAVLFFAPWAIENAVVDVREQIKPTETRWQGVISVGFVPTFATESAEGWIKACGKAFAEENGNALVSVRVMTKVGVETGAAAQTLPDVLIFGENVLDREMWRDLFGEESPAAVAKADYLLLGNRGMLEKAGWSEEMELEETLRLVQEKKLGIAAPKRDYADPMEALRNMGEATEEVVQDIYARVWPDFVLEEKYALYVATQREARRLAALRSAGHGFEAVEYPAKDGEGLLCAVVRDELTGRTDAAESRPWCEKYVAFLREEAQKARLEDVGLLPAG